MCWRRPCRLRDDHPRRAAAVEDGIPDPSARSARAPGGPARPRTPGGHRRRPGSALGRLPDADTVTVRVRPARTADVAVVRRLVDLYAAKRILLDKATVTLYEDVQEFLVAETDDGAVVGCGALHVMWEDLGEVRTLAV